MWRVKRSPTTSWTWRAGCGYNVDVTPDGKNRLDGRQRQRWRIRRQIDTVSVIDLEANPPA
jgi:hypothetical protein